MQKWWICCNHTLITGKVLSSFALPTLIKDSSNHFKNNLHFHSNYTFEAAKVACGNVAGLISWTMAMAQFYSVNKDVLPLKANLAVMQGKYMGAKRELEAAEALLQAKEVRMIAKS